VVFKENAGDAAGLSGVLSAFDIERFADTISLIPMCESLNRKGSLWPHETTI